MKSKILKTGLVFAILAGILIYISRTQHKFQVMTGETMNTYYKISVRTSQENTLLHNKIKAELQQINNEMSVFENMSDISEFNKSGGEWVDVPENLAQVLKSAYQVYQQTNGYFDPSVGHLVDIWGFGKNKTIKVPSEEEIAAAKKMVGMNKISFSKDFSRAKKSVPEISLNLSAIAKGYGVDRITKVLEDAGYKDFIVEIGGEVVARGNRSDKDEGWNIGIAKPENLSAEGNSSDLYEYVVRLKDMAVATSGDYRNYFYVGDKKYSHTIDPKTGYPVEHDLASVTVFHKDCMKADALATGIMSMGEEKGLEFANNNKIAVIMAVRKENGYLTLLSNQAKKFINDNAITTEEQPK